MLKLFEPDNENVNTGADGYAHALKAHAVAWKCTEHTKSKILGCGICVTTMTSLNIIQNIKSTIKSNYAQRINFGVIN